MTETTWYQISLPPLSASREKALTEEMLKGSSRARELLIRANIRFALTCARKYQGLGLGLHDLYGEAVTGLIKAVDHYDPSRQARLITCASLWIRNEILQAVNKCGASQRLSDRDFRNFIQAKKILSALQNQENQSGQLPLAAASTGLSSAYIAELLQLKSLCLSIDSPAGDEGKEPAADNFPGGWRWLSDSRLLPEDMALKSCFTEDLQKALHTLPPAERIVYMRHQGILGYKQENFSQIGQRYGHTKQWAFLKAQAAEKRLAKMLQDWLA